MTRLIAKRWRRNMDVFSKTTNVFVPMVAITPRRLIIATHQVQPLPQALRPPQALQPPHLSPAACVCRTVDVPMMNRTVVGLRRIMDVLGRMVIVTVKMAALLQRLASFAGLRIHRHLRSNPNRNPEIGGMFWTSLSHGFQDQNGCHASWILCSVHRVAQDLHGVHCSTGDL